MSRRDPNAFSLIRLGPHLGFAMIFKPCCLTNAQDKHQLLHGRSWCFRALDLRIVKGNLYGILVWTLRNRTAVGCKRSRLSIRTNDDSDALKRTAISPCNVQDNAITQSYVLSSLDKVNRSVR